MEHPFRHFFSRGLPRAARVSRVRREEPHQLGECVVAGAPGPGRYRGAVGAAETTPPIGPVFRYLRSRRKATDLRHGGERR
jgi:hypothetical protein